MSVIAVVPACNESGSILNVMRQLRRAHVEGCVVVCNGCTDRTESIVRANGPRLFGAFACVATADRLGPDVPRAIGAYRALRQFPSASSLLCMDGDCSGSFGPALEAFLGEVTRSGAQIAWPADSASLHQRRTDEQLWHGYLQKARPHLLGIQPANCPLWIDRGVFSVLSPGALWHPGLWFAQAVHSSLRLCAIPFDGRCLGNKARSRQHNERMQETLIGDAIEGIRVLRMQKPGRRWHGRVYQGYHPLRRVDLLDQAASSFQVLV